VFRDTAALSNAETPEGSTFTYNLNNVSLTPVQTYANRYVEMPDFETNTTTISQVYGATDAAAMQSVFTNSAAKTVIVWYDKLGRNTNEVNYNGWDNGSHYITFRVRSDGHIQIGTNGNSATVFAKPPLLTASNDWVNIFTAITQSADGTIKAYHNITGDINAGPPVDTSFPAITKNIGAVIQQSVFDPTSVPSNLLNLVNFGTRSFVSKTEAHWKDLFVIPEALSLSQIQALYNRPRHVVDMHGTNMTRLGNIISFSSTVETEKRIGIPVYMHGKAYFEFDADNFSVFNNHIWGLAETTKLPLSSYMGSEVSQTGRALTVGMMSKSGLYFGGSWFTYKNVVGTRSVLTNDTTTVRRTYCLAVDYTTGHAWWGIDGYFGGYNPATRVAVAGRTAQVDPALDSTTPNTTTPDLEIRRMRYAVIRNYRDTTRLYPKSVVSQVVVPVHAGRVHAVLHVRELVAVFPVLGRFPQHAPRRHGLLARKLGRVQ